MLNRILVKSLLNRGNISNFRSRQLRMCHDQPHILDSSEEIIQRQQGRVNEIAINLPDNRNELNENAAEKLYQALLNFENDNDSHVALLFGVGGNFCSGLTESAKRYKSVLLECMLKRKKPIIAVLNGYTTMFGFELALMCDLRIGDETLVIGFKSTEEQLDVSPEIYEKLVAMVGLTFASEIILTRVNIQGKKAQLIGLCNLVNETGTAMGHALTTARCISKFPIERLLENRQQLMSAMRRI